MGKKRRQFTDKFKAKIALEAVKGVKTLTELVRRTILRNCLGKSKPAI